ncbi:MAG: FGGY-family carbohydrate kinase [Mesorhizobium sp.]
MMPRYVCSVDVGTGSARAGVFQADGQLLGRGVEPILLNRPSADYAEHDSENIWQSVCKAVQAAVGAAGVKPEDIAGLSFDATCSLVVRGREGEPVSVSPGGDDRWDTIVWLDHRALAEADQCSATGHEVLDFIGGTMSPEMETPKLMWLKRHLPKSWERAGHFFDLADFLTWRASGSTERSQCTVTAKWTYLAHERAPWRRDFFEAVGIGDMLERGTVPPSAVSPGTDLGPLTAEAAQALGLTQKCRVGAGLIDAFAGALGVLGPYAGKPEELARQMALIAGTSSCVMTMASEPKQLRGFWGPYYGTILPGLWLTEGGQSATGALLDHVIRLHGAGGEPSAAMHQRIADRINALRAEEDDLSPRLHVLPDFHGNRSPYADSHALGVVSGLTLDASFDSLCRLYWRTAVGVALGVRHILDTLNAHGHDIDTLHVTGGHTRNALLMELYADATGCTVVEPETDEAVLLGTAMIAAAACGLYPSLAEAATAMARPARKRSANGGHSARYDRDYRVFLEMHKQRKALDEIAQ